MGRLCGEPRLRVDEDRLAYGFGECGRISGNRCKRRTSTTEGSPFFVKVVRVSFPMPSVFVFFPSRYVNILITFNSASCTRALFYRILDTKARRVLHDVSFSNPYQTINWIQLVWSLSLFSLICHLQECNLISSC